jgi:hypothetical protein
VEESQTTKSVLWEALSRADLETEQAEQFDPRLNHIGPRVHFPQDGGVVHVEIESASSARVFAEVDGVRVPGAERRIRLSEDASPLGNGLRIWGGILALAASLDWHTPTRSP